jgi:hypothetical protein
MASGSTAIAMITDTVSARTEQVSASSVRRPLDVSIDAVQRLSARVTLTCARSGFSGMARTSRRTAVTTLS